VERKKLDYLQIALEINKNYAWLVGIQESEGGRKMAIKTLKDVKEALKDIPDHVLENLGVGINPETEESVSLLYWSGFEEEDAERTYRGILEEYPLLKGIEKWINVISLLESKACKGSKEGKQ
jgi:hypothetical protein